MALTDPVDIYCERLDPGFWAEPLDVLAYPFQGRGPSLMAVAGLFFGVLNVIASVNPIGFAIVAGMAFFYVRWQRAAKAALAAAWVEPKVPEVAPEPKAEPPEEEE